MVENSSLLELTTALDLLKVPPPVNPKKVGRKLKTIARNEDEDSEKQGSMILSLRDSVERICESFT